MTLQSLNAIVRTLQDAAQNQSTADKLHPVADTVLVSTYIDFQG